MDIDNDYYLAKFESKVDYSNVLSRGPSVIFDHYLTIQQWVNSFLDYESVPSMCGSLGSYPKVVRCHL